MWSLTSVEGINLKIWIAFRILLIAWQLTLFLERNYYPCQRQKGLGLLLEPRGFKTECNMCEPHALYMSFVWSGFLLYMSVGFLLSENSGYILKNYPFPFWWRVCISFPVPLHTSVKRRKESLFVCYTNTQTALEWKNKSHFSWWSNLFDGQDLLSSYFAVFYPFNN